MTQLDLFTDATWPSTKAISKVVYKILEAGPHSLSIAEIGNTTGYGPHSVRSAIWWLERRGKIERITGEFDDQGRLIYRLARQPERE